MHYFDIHTHRATGNKEVLSIRSFSLTDEGVVLPDGDLIAVGLHPWYATLEKLEPDLQRLRLAARQKHVLMIGECGLDKVRGVPLSDQMMILEKQIALAGELGKPLILHCVRAFAELMAVKDRLKVSVPMVIHGFNKSEELGRQLIDKGFILSFGAAVLKAGSGAAALAQSTDDFFLETDDSDVAIEAIYESVANLKKCYVEDLKARIFASWKKLI